MLYLSELRKTNAGLLLALPLICFIIGGCATEESPENGIIKDTETGITQDSSPESPGNPTPSTPPPDQVKKGVITDFTFSHSSDNRDSVPFTLGQPFKKGDLPSGYVVSAFLENNQMIDVQTDVKSRHSDGSTRHAILTFDIPPGFGGDEAKVRIKPSLADESGNKNAKTLSGLINSGYDAVLNLQVYSIHQKRISFGDRIASWNPGDVLTLVVNGKQYTHIVEKAGSGYQAGQAIAKSFAEQITEGNPDISADYRHENLILIADKGETMVVSYENTGHAPVLIEDQSFASQPVNYNVSALKALETAANEGKEIQWLSGPLASEWIVSSNLTDPKTGVENPHIAVRFHIRAFSNSNSVKTDVVVENTWSYVAEPQNYYYDVSLISEGKEVYQQNKLLHYVHSRWKKTVWFGTEPRIDVRHNLDYLLASKQLPNYDTSLDIPQTVLDDLVSNWRGEKTMPMHIGDATPHMPVAGAHSDIGPLPKWQVLYLLSMDAGARRVTLESADLSGTWSIHYRNKNTGYPITLDDYPYMTILGLRSDTYNPHTGKNEAFPKCGKVCSSPYIQDAAHQPSFAYLPYLVTGEYYYLEELQFWAGYNQLRSNPAYRGAALGLPKGQIRSLAWMLRTLAHAAAITPDAHPLKPYFKKQLHNSLDYYNDRYTNNPDANRFGFIDQDYALNYSDGRALAPWQDDFFTWAVGHAVELGFNEAEPLLLWKAKFPIGRMTAPGYCWIHAAPYSMTVRDARGEAFYSSFEEIYKNMVSEAVYSTPCASDEMATAIGGVVAGQMTGYAHSPSGYPSNFQPALALASETGLPNAREAWQIFADRPVKPEYNGYPNWAIVPRKVNNPGPLGSGENVDASDSGKPDPGTPNPGKSGIPNRDQGTPGHPSYDAFVSLGGRVNAIIGEVVRLSAGVSNANSPVVSWRVLEQPSNSLTVFGNADASVTSFTANTAGKYRIEATISDANNTRTGEVVVEYAEKAASTSIILADNTAISLGTYDCKGKGPVGEGPNVCRTISDFSGMIEDRLNGNMLMFGGGHSATARTDIDVFDFDTMNWNSAYKSTPCSEMNEQNFDKNDGKWISTGHPTSRHTYDLLGSTAYPHELLLLRGGGEANGAISCVAFNQYSSNRVAHYSFETGKWSYGDIGEWDRLSASELDPVSGWFIFVSSYGIHGYDPKNKKAFTINKFVRQLGYANNLVYYPPLDSFYYFTVGDAVQVYELKLNRTDRLKTTLTRVENISGDIPGSSETAWDYDSANKVIGGGIKDGRFFVFDPIAKHWHSKKIEVVDSGLNVGTVAFHAMAYSSNQNVYVFKTNYPSGHKIWLYRYKNRMTGSNAGK